MKRVLILALGCLLAALLLFPYLAGPARSGVHISGDGAGDIVLAVPRAATPVQAALEVILVDNWSKLRHIPGAQAMCGRACLVPYDVVTITHLIPNRTSVSLLILTDGLSPACVANVITATATRAELPKDAGCFPIQAKRWRLPLGLGYV